MPIKDFSTLLSKITKYNRVHLGFDPSVALLLGLSAQYLVRCLEPVNVCHSITTRETPKRRMKETLFTRYCNTVEPMMLADNRKATLQAIHTDTVNKAVKDQKNNTVLDGLPNPINDSEKDLTRKERATLAQLRSGYCKLLDSYKSRKDKTTGTLFTPDPAEYKSNLDLIINNTASPMAKHPKVLALTVDPKLIYSTYIHNISFHAHKPLQLIKPLTATG